MRSAGRGHLDFARVRCATYGELAIWPYMLAHLLGTHYLTISETLSETLPLAFQFFDLN